MNKEPTQRGHMFDDSLAEAAAKILIGMVLLATFGLGVAAGAVFF